MNVNHIFCTAISGHFRLKPLKVERVLFYAQYKIDHLIFCDKCQKGKDFVGSQSNLWRVIFLQQLKQNLSQQIMAEFRRSHALRKLNSDITSKRQKVNDLKSEMLSSNTQPMWIEIFVACSNDIWRYFDITLAFISTYRTLNN